MARIRRRCAPKRRAQTQAYSRQLRIFKRNQLFQQAPFHTFPARDPLLSPWFFSKLRVVDFFDPSLGEANSSVSHTILIFPGKNATLNLVCSHTIPFSCAIQISPYPIEFYFFKGFLNLSRASLRMLVRIPAAARTRQERAPEANCE